VQSRAKADASRIIPRRWLGGALSSLLDAELGLRTLSARGLSFVRGGGRHVLVIGAGFIGSHVAEALLSQGTPTRVVTRSHASSEVLEALSGADLIIGDVMNPDVLDSALTDVRQVVLCAGGLTPADSMASPVADLQASLSPLLAVLAALKRRPGTGITYMSSGGTVYGEPIRLPICEDHPTEPIVAYGITHLAGEKYIALYRRLYGVPARILRASNMYGERQPANRNQGVVAVFLRRIAAGEPIVVSGDGLIVRDYLYVRDLAAAITSLLRSDGGPTVLNVGSGEGTSLRELIGLIEEVTHLSARVEYAASRPFDVSRIVLDVSRLREIIPFHPLSLRNGLELTWRSLRDG
jgi:UDP-glucose 4-epimerase